MNLNIIDTVTSFGIFNEGHSSQTGFSIHLILRLPLTFLRLGQTQLKSCNLIIYPGNTNCKGINSTVKHLIHSHSSGMIDFDFIDDITSYFQ